MDAAERAVAEIVAARKAGKKAPAKRKPAKHAGAKKPQVASPSEPSVPSGRDSHGRFAKGNTVAVLAGTAFVPGVCANPGGRPRMADALVRAGEQEDVLFPGQPRVEYAAVAVWRKACSGDVAAFREIADRTEGKVAQGLELTGKDGGPVEVNVDDARDAFASRIAGLAARAAESGSDSEPE